MFTCDLTDELRGSGVTATCLHPATRMPTRMTQDARATPTDSIASGVRATLQLALDEDAEALNGRYYDGLDEAVAHSQAYNPDARDRLRRLTERLLRDP